MTPSADNPVKGAWGGWLTEATLSVPDPTDALAYWAELLGGDVEKDSVALGSGTKLRVSEGQPGLATATLMLAADVGQQSEEAVAAGESRDPDNRDLVITGASEVPERAVGEDSRLGHLTFTSPDP